MQVKLAGYFSGKTPKRKICLLKDGSTANSLCNGRQNQNTEKDT
jgi:hypothetical protein